ncbi:hypothetical protein ABIE27_001961 [Paenibacillus sp. 4624]|uniref:hypothetical protein n=1 Tax=Paenibacillus sp. 4624 TaxID=3156453 RepID=UPI003D1D802F
MKKKHILWISAGVLTIWALSGFFISLWFGKPDGGGTFGDMFGAINALFSGFAFAGLIYTIAVQRQELQEQRKSIDMQTNEMKLQVNASKMQTEELALQREAIQMQTEELALQRKAIEMQTEETARSADQLERQKQVMDYQLTLTTVNDLIKLKNSILDKLKVAFGNSDATGFEAIETLSGLMEDHPNRSFDTQLIVLRRYFSTYTLLIEFISKANFSDVQVNDLKRIVMANTSVEEVNVLERIAISTSNQQLRAFIKDFAKYNI